MRRKLSIILVLVFTLSCSIAGFAQLGGLFKNKKPSDPDKAPEYTEADKQKIAEIEQRPAVQDEIQKEWDEVRREHLQSAYAINQTANWSITDDPMNHPGAARGGDRLYSNPMMQIYLNNIGQRLVPKDSPNLYTFRVLLDPMPKAEALSTGTIYISTGLISLLDSEAQLSYILAHEIAHVEQNHAYNRIRNSIVEQELYKEKEARAAAIKGIATLAGGLGGGLLGGAIHGASGAGIGALAGGLGGYVVGNMLAGPHMQLTEWSTVEEDEADELGAKYMVTQGYDVREVPRLYASLDRIVGKDSRLGLGFMGSPRRVRERSAHIQQLLNGALRADITKLVQSNGLLGSSAEFPVLLSAARRDNGILAMEYDLFAMARQNLEDAAAQRSNDPSVHFYLSKVVALTAHTPEDKRQAVAHIADAIRLDAARGSIPALHLEYALSLLDQDNVANKDQVIHELKTYVALYQRDNAGALPGNMSAIFDYFNLVGETSWYLPPEWYPATQLFNNGGTTIAPDAVIRKAMAVTGSSAAPAPAAPHVKLASADTNISVRRRAH